MTLRFLSALPIALIVSFALVWLMQLLIWFEKTKSEFEPPQFISVSTVDIREINTKDNTNSSAQEEVQKEPEQEEHVPEDIKINEKAEVNPEKLLKLSELGKIELPQKKKKKVVKKVKKKIRKKPSNKSQNRQKASSLKPPVRLSYSKPVYPRAALDRKIQGVVRVRFTILKSGAVSNIRIISGPSIFHNAARNAVRKWRFNKQPIPRSNVVVPISFSIR